MRIADLFYSLQGEGKLIGVPSAFIRTSGCNLRCTWCDTPYASWDPEGENWTVRAVMDAVAKFPTKYVVVTGGEPMITPRIGDLIDALAMENYHITVETAATVFKPVGLHLASMSPKLSNSTPHDREGGKYVRIHDEQRLNTFVIQKFIDTSPDFQLKFVVSERKDLVEIDAILQQLKGWHPSDVQLMPEGTNVTDLRSRSDWINDVCKQTGFRYSPRLHVELYGNRRGT